MFPLTGFIIVFSYFKNTKENTDGLPPQFRDSVAQGMEYLKEVGSQIQQALANFGIIFLFVYASRNHFKSFLIFHLIVVIVENLKARNINFICYE